MASNKLFLLVLFLFSQYVAVSTDLVEIAYYRQPVDHFRYGTRLNQETFAQRYYIDRTFWSGPEEGGPFLVYFGGESPLNEEIVGVPGLIAHSAPHLSALVLYIEHRFYGMSVPFGSIDLAMRDPEVRGCLTTTQALADFHKIITDVKRNLSAQNSPVIVMGGSYSGVLAALFRWKYPTVATGALASSAPMEFDVSHSGNFYSVVSRAFQEINHDCHNKIRQSWKVIDDRANQPGGLDYLSQTFRTCHPLLNAEGLKVFLEGLYTSIAQYNGRFSYWINLICDKIVDPSNGDLTVAIARAVNATFLNVPPCFDISSWAVPTPFSLDENSTKAWNWQFCSELLIPFHSDGDTMFPVKSLSLSGYMASCKAAYSTTLRPWVVDPEEHDVYAILQGYGSNIIFSNGLRDPFSSVGVLKDISKTVVAIKTNEGSHCLDMTEAQSDDPEWLVHQRQKEVRIFMEWIEKANHSSCARLTPHLWIILLVFFWLWLL